jgi:large conductance mechanosensitive channel
MVDLDDAGEALLQGEQEVEKRARRFWSGFSDFALQDNVLEVAVGLMYVIT